MVYRQNLHTHSVYCDGKNTPEEMVKRAIELGFDTIGFSGHSTTNFDIDWHMTYENQKKYIGEVNRLKIKYKDEICVLLGLEYEMYSGTSYDGFDYVIASMHFLKTKDGYISFDEKAETVKKLIDEHFGGDGMAYAKEYYAQFSRLSDYGKFDIVGHFDIITKHIDTHDFFDTGSREYINAALSALHEIAKTHKVFEVNTGAIKRGYRKTPYPEPFILKEMKNLGIIPIITCDCHNKDFLGGNYDDAIELLKSCGYKTVGVMKNGKIKEEKL